MSYFRALSEGLAHGQDIRMPLGLANVVPKKTIKFTLSQIKKDKTREDYLHRCGM